MLESSNKHSHVLNVTLKREREREKLGFSRTKLGEEGNVGYMIMNVVPFPKANGMSFHDIVIGKAQTQPISPKDKSTKLDSS